MHTFCKFIILSYLIFSLSGCSYLGTTVNVINSEQLKGIKSVYLPSSYEKDILIREITKTKLFLIVDDSTTADGILYCKISFDFKRYETNVIAKLLLADTKSRVTIATSEHNTFWGNNYLMPPTYEESLNDAIIGAISGLAGKMKKN